MGETEGKEKKNRLGNMETKRKKNHRNSKFSGVGRYPNKQKTTEGVNPPNHQEAEWDAKKGNGQRVPTPSDARKN